MNGKVSIPSSDPNHRRPHGSNADRPGGSLLWLALALTLLGGGAVMSAQASPVYLNELEMRPLGLSERVELYNAGTDTADVSGWTIQGSKSSYVIPTPTLIAPGQYIALQVGDLQGERGGVTGLIDLVLDGELLARTTVDEVSYGEEGSAPLPPEGMSLARAPDASAGTPPPPGPATDGLVWTIDTTPTFGELNDAPVPEMGSSGVINEFDASHVGAGDLVELYNPGPDEIHLYGWYLINGDSLDPLSGFIPPGGFYLQVTSAGFELEEIGLLYLFRSDGTRVDQLGFHDAPELGSGECLGRCPDGAEPYLGYSYATSGGGVTFLPMPCSPGESNEPCGPTPATSVTWGRLKRLFE